MTVANTTLSIAFRSNSVQYMRIGYEKRFTELVNSVKDTGIIIENIYFSKTSDSVYVSFSFPKAIENVLGITEENYVGHFVISSHKRFYAVNVKTFYTQQAKDINELEETIRTYILSIINEEIPYNNCVVILNNYELDMLRIIERSKQSSMSLEVHENDFVKPIFDVYFTDSYKSIVAVTRDTFTCKALNRMRKKGCIITMPIPKNKRARVIVSNTAKTFLSKYGAELPPETWKAYNEDRTFKLDTDFDEGEGYVDFDAKTYTPTDEELTSLDISLEWYDAFEKVHSAIVTEGVPSTSERNAWVDMLADKVDVWLPEGSKVIAQYYASKRNRGMFTINKAGAPEFFQLVLHPYTKLEREGNVYSMFGANAYETLVALKDKVETINFDVVKLYKVTEDDLKAFIMLKQIERTGVAIALQFRMAMHYEDINESERNSAYAHIVRNDEGRTSTLSPKMNKPQLIRLTELIYKYKDLSIWTTAMVHNPAKGAKIYRFHTTDGAKALFGVAEQYMPYVVDDIIADDQPCLPIIGNINRGELTFIRPSELYIY